VSEEVENISRGEGAPGASVEKGERDPQAVNVKERRGGGEQGHTAPVN